MIYRAIDALEPEEARQWLIANDKEAADFWKHAEAFGLVDAVRDNLNSFGYETQLGRVYITPPSSAGLREKDDL